jgi:hypothetical protein
MKKLIGLMAIIAAIAVMVVATQFSNRPAIEDAVLTGLEAGRVETVDAMDCALAPPMADFRQWHHTTPLAVNGEVSTMPEIVVVASNGFSEESAHFRIQRTAVAVGTAIEATEVNILPQAWAAASTKTTNGARGTWQCDVGEVVCGMIRIC